MKSDNANINGIIVINKEKGFTSHDVVAKMRRILGTRKIGHTGTLDPEATGVLPVCIGKATKVCDMILNSDKEYIAEIKFGITTDTQDIFGNILEEKSVSLSKDEIENAVMSFEGEIEQIPPMYSAVKSFTNTRARALRWNGAREKLQLRKSTFWKRAVTRQKSRFYVQKAHISAHFAVT